MIFSNLNIYTPVHGTLFSARLTFAMSLVRERIDGCNRLGDLAVRSIFHLSENESGIFSPMAPYEYPRLVFPDL